MATRKSLPIADGAPVGSAWAAALPGAASEAAEFKDILPQARDALGALIDHLVVEARALPPSPQEHDPLGFERPLFVPIEISDCAVRVIVSLDAGLLGRLDAIARRSGTTRAGLLARGARLVIAEDTAG